MFTEMCSRTFLLTVLLSETTFAHSLNFIRNRENSHEVSILQDPISLNTDQSFADVKNVYYVTAPRSKIIIEYTDDDSYNTYEKGYDSSRESTVEENSAFQPWSILWYIGSFGGLIAFFLIVSCSEWCCRNRSRELNSELTTPSSPTPSENPPPAYDLFAPPSYDSLCHNEEKSEYDVYVVPVHALSAIAENSALQTDDTPPAYSSDRQIQISNTNEVLLNVSSIDEDYTERHKAT